MAFVRRLTSRLSSKAALRYAIRLCDEGRHSDALPLLVRAARAGLPDAKYRIGLVYLQGFGVPASRVEATRWLERAALADHHGAQTALAALFVHGLASGAEGAAQQLGGRLFAAEPAAVLACPP